jgi:signal peptidase I
VTATVAAVTTAVLVAGAFLLRHCYIFVTVRGNSMWPAYTDGQWVLVRRTRRCRPGDVVMFRAPAGSDIGWLIKRVSAVGGDPVPADLRTLVEDGPVPDGHVAVRGDSERSLDSRHFGFVPAARIVGRVRRPPPRQSLDDRAG